MSRPLRLELTVAEAAAALAALEVSERLLPRMRPTEAAASAKRKLHAALNNDLVDKTLDEYGGTT